jgi:hypothetical protein
MPGFPLTIVSQTTCFHQAPAKIAPSQTAVFIVGGLAATSASQIGVIGCPFTLPGPKYQPCVTVKWAMPSTKVFAQGKPLIVMPPPGSGPGPGICQSAEQIPQGAPVVQMNQNKVFCL